MKPRRERIISHAVREVLLGCIAFAGAWMFLNHHLLYLQEGATPLAVSAASYALTTAVLYLFIRAFAFVSKIRVPWLSVRADTCPECGQQIEDGTPEGAEARVIAAAPAAPEPAPAVARMPVVPAAPAPRRNPFESGVPRRVHVRRVAGASLPYPNAPLE